MNINSFSIPRGALTEMSGSAGSGKTEAVLAYLASNPATRVAWVETDFSIYPCAFPTHGVSLRNVVFVDVSQASEKTALWAVSQIVSSQVFGVVVLSVRIREMVALRRLQLAAGKNQTVIILLAEEPMSGVTWPIHLQLRASRSPETGKIKLTILKQKGGGLWQPQSA